MLELTPRKFPNRKRPRRDPSPRFKADVSGQLDYVKGCAQAQVPEKHLARDVLAVLAGLDLAAVEAKYSSLGRHGYHPRHVLGALVYGSLVGLHHSTKLARAMVTDAALRLVAGGHAISAGRLREFRRTHTELFVEANRQILKMAADKGLLSAEHLAVDSVRLRAHASTKAARTVVRSQARLEELAAVDVSGLDEAARLEHEQKLHKHRSALEECTRQGRTNLVTTCPTAGLLKFPNGASAPGHRVTMTAAGVRERLIVDVLIDAESNDYGKLETAARRARDTLLGVGVDVDKMQLAADAGFWSETDLAFAADNRNWVDVLLAERQQTYRGDSEHQRLFKPNDFTIQADGSALCPAGRQMEGPLADRGKIRYYGNGCGECGLKPQCTRGKRRHLTLNGRYSQVRSQMRLRMSKSDAAQRYNERIATIEPVFSSLQEAMGFRRLSSRFESSIRAEILLKALSYNLSRLLSGVRRLCCVRIWLSWVRPDQRPQVS